MGQWLKENWFKIGLLAVFLVAAVSVANYYLYFLPHQQIVETNLIANRELAKQNLDMQEKCSQAAEARFKETWHDFGSVGDSRDYKSHYNSELNKCFIEMTYYHINSNGDGSRNYEDDLYDVYERKEYGRFDRIAEKDQSDSVVKPVWCSMLDKYCKTEEEFVAFVKKYMEN